MGPQVVAWSKVLWVRVEVSYLFRVSPTRLTWISLVAAFLKFISFVQIVREVNVALERSLRAEVVDLADDDDNDSDDELEIGDANDLRPGELTSSSLDT